MIKPEKLNKGSTIAVICPSWGGSSVFKHVYKKGIERLKEVFEFNIKEFPTTNIDPQELYEKPELRAKDINDAFADKEVDGIITVIGGDDGIRVLKYIDKNTIRDNPKFFMGYSDTTVFNFFFSQLGLVTFNGPSVMAGFAESGDLKLDFIEHVRSFLFKNWDDYVYKPFFEYSDKYLDWNDPENLNKKNDNYKLNNEGWKFIQGNEIVHGRLTGGCIEVFEFMKQTDYWPINSYWNDRIVFFETSEEKPTPEQVGHMLRNYGIQGIFDRIKGILFGRPKGYTDEEKQELDNVILKILKEFGKTDLPVVTNVDFGHTDPQFILPLGCELKIDIEKKELVLLENPFRKKEIKGVDEEVEVEDWVD